MKLSICVVTLLCLIAWAEAKDYWRDAVMVEPCFEGKGGKPAKMKLPEEGFVKGMRFTHANGEVNCNANHKEYNSRWGCNVKWGNLKSKIGVIVTDEFKNVILPVEARLKPRTTFFYTGGNSPMAKEITFYDDTKPTFLDPSTILNLWYSEDLYNIHPSDNNGRVCLTAQVLYANIEL